LTESVEAWVEVLAESARVAGRTEADARVLAHRCGRSILALIALTGIVALTVGARVAGLTLTLVGVAEASHLAQNIKIIPYLDSA